MNITGIITEYNPFHNGHKFHLEEAKKQTNCDGVICIMSGNFVQRGGPAIVDKWQRTEMALNNGVDLIIELPTFYAVSSAEFFAKGAVSILNSLGVVDNIFFGSECGDSKKLLEIAKVLVSEDSDFQNLLKRNLSLGLTFAKSREKSLIEYLNDEDINNIVTSSNNILGIEYIKSILKLNSKIKPYTINRINSGYNSLNVNDSICSASAIRNALKNNSLNTINYTMPKDTYDIINRVIESGFNLVYNEDFYQILSSIIIRDKDNLTDYFEVNEGIENKIYNSIFKCHNIETLQNEIKSKRYTMTKISRTLNNIMLGIKGDDILKTKDLTNIPYVRVLAFNEKGCEILKEIKKNSEIEVITKFSKIKYINSNIFNTLINYDIKATNMYNLIYYKNNFDMLKAPLDYITSPKYIK
mgnify:CR=1 FL=1